ncbi:MAG TPA: SxtJ family membrane protein [Gemmatimonadaceae bacterium]|nr:SxtJ family membrane protein [Gemmatimonadaceae bacterium]
MTRAEGRRFAWTLAAGFAVLALLAVWRGRERAAMILAAAGVIGLLAGLLVPTRLGPAERAWTALGTALSRVTSPVFFGVLYLLVITPTGFVRRRLGRSPLARAADAPSYWVRRATRSAEEARSAMEHLF